MNAEIRNEGTTAILRPEGALNVVTVDRLREDWQAWFQQNPAVKLVVVDLAAVEFIDSSGLGLLIALLKWAGGRGGDVRIAGLRKTVRMIFEITRTYKVFEIFDTADEALRVS